MLDAQLIADAGDDEVYQIVDRLRRVIETGHGRQNDSSGIGESFHVFQLVAAQRSLPRHDNQLPSFLQVNVGRPLDQV